jgi:hypothetical protein
MRKMLTKAELKITPQEYTARKYLIALSVSPDGASYFSFYFCIVIGYWLRFLPDETSDALKARIRKNYAYYTEMPLSSVNLRASRQPRT